MARFANATVTSTSPLRVVMHGDHDHPLPAQRLDTYTPTVGDIVRVQVRRSGLVPIVQGRVAT